LTSLKTFNPDIIITDLIMPNIDGEQLCRIIRAKNQFRDTVIIILSAIAAEENFDFQSVGADACIAKGPVEEMERNIQTAYSSVNQNSAPEILGTETVFKRQITTELLARKRHFAITLESIEDAFLELTPTRKITFCNSKASLFFNAPQEQILSSDFLDLFTGKQRDIIEENFNTIDNNPITIEDPDFTEINGRFLRFKLIPVKNKNEDCTLVLIRDISRQRRHEQEIKSYMHHLEEMVQKRTAEKDFINKALELKIAEREKINIELEFVARQWSNTFDTIPDFIAVLDTKMRYVRVNKTMADFLDKDPEELLGQNCYRVLHNKEEPCKTCPHLRAIKENRSVSEEVDYSYIGFPMLVTCSPCFHDDGTLLGSIYVGRDITQQKTSELERETLIKELQDALAKVKLLSGIIPICASCKKIRDDKGFWNQVEAYITNHSEAKFSHDICPECAKK
ncbi:MAG: PAS domain-containing protein, partial [Desulfocapsa sp.]|nr:PAS domain-containing protein [Desulfocapsa sp.]